MAESERERERFGREGRRGEGEGERERERVCGFKAESMGLWEVAETWGPFFYPKPCLCFFYWR